METKKVYLVICESNLPGSFMYTIEDAFDTEEKAKNCVGSCIVDLIKQCDAKDFYPRYFADWWAEASGKESVVYSCEDESFYVKYYVEEVDVN